MNVLVLIFILLMICGILKGFKSGFVKEVGGVVSLFMALVVLSVVFLLLASIWEKNTKTLVASIVLLVFAGILYRLVSVVMKSVETLAKLPLISIVNRLFGGAAGALEILILFWIMYMVMEGLPMGRFGDQVMAWTKENVILFHVYQKNYIANWIVGLKGVL